MTKTYKLWQVEVSKKEIQRLIKDNPELLKEESGACPYFWPKEGEDYYVVFSEWSVGKYTNTQELDKMNIEAWVYRTKELALRDLERHKALVRIWKYVVDNGLEFEPDWQSRLWCSSSRKYYIDYSYCECRFWTDYCNNYQDVVFMPYFRTESDAKQVIKNCEHDLKIIFWVK